MDSRGPTFHLALTPLGSELDTQKRGCSLPGGTHTPASDLGKKGPVGNEIARPQVIVSLSPPPTSVLAVSVTVGGKQYLLGLYDTAGQVSVLASGRFL